MVIVSRVNAFLRGAFVQDWKRNERKLYAFHTIICPTFILIYSSAMSPYFQKCVSVCILMYWTVHKSQDVLFYLQDVGCFISYVYAFIFRYKINLTGL